MKDAVDILNEEIEYLRSLLADLLADCENWGCAPDERLLTAPQGSPIQTALPL